MMSTSGNASRRSIVAGLVVVVLLTAACSSSSGGSSDGTSGGSWTRLSPTELEATMKEQDVFLVNVHVPYEGEIPGTDAFIPYNEIASRIGELPSDASTLVLYCRSGHMSTVAAQALVGAGVTGFSELAGGYTAWAEAGLPFVVRSSG